MWERIWCVSAGGGLCCRWVCRGDVLRVVNARCTAGGDIMIGVQREEI